MAGSVDNYYWGADNLTELCTNDCMFAVDAWNTNVEARCFYDEIASYNKLVPAASVSDRFSDGLHIACITNRK